MNVTEKQKQRLIDFMRANPDFGRGRLRYNRENKRKIDELWEEVTSILNSAGCGPQKQPKEWAKTWRDWKSNLLKRVATYKSYATGTGGGQPKILDTSPAEDDLLEFLTPDASGMSNIPEGGAIDVPISVDLTTERVSTSHKLQNSTLHPIYTDLTVERDLSQKLQNRSTSHPICTNLTTERVSLQNLENPSTSQIMKKFSISPNLQIGKSTKKTTSCFQRLEEHPFHSDVRNIDTEDLPINISSNILRSIENEQENQQKQVHSTKSSPILAKNMKRYSDDAVDNPNKKIRQNVKHLFEQHTTDYCNLQERMLQLKQEKLAILKERLELKRKDHEEHANFFVSFLEKIDELTNIIRSICPQYLED